MSFYLLKANIFQRFHYHIFCKLHISLMYKTAVEDELKAGVLKEIKLNDFKILHDFDFIWEKDSVYPNKYLSFCKEFAK